MVEETYWTKDVGDGAARQEKDSQKRRKKKKTTTTTTTPRQTVGVNLLRISF